MLLSAACDSTLYVRDGQQILRKDPALQGNNTLKESELRPGIRTEANARVLGLKPEVYIYNLGKQIEQDSSWVKRKVYDKLDPRAGVENAVVKWLTEEVGEAPHLVSEQPIDDDADNLESIYFSEGFLDASVYGEVLPVKNQPRKADIVFRIHENAPYHLSQIDYLGGDPYMRYLLDSTREQSLLKPGARYSQSNVADERVRIANLMREHGYYRFGPELISYVADTTVNPPRAGVLLRLRDSLPPTDSIPEPVLDSLAANNAPRKLNLEVLLPDTVDRYTVNRVTIRLRRADDPADANALAFDLQRLSPAVMRAYHIDGRWLRPEYDFTVVTLPEIARRNRLSMIARRVAFFPGQEYNQMLQRRTSAQLAALGIFRSSSVTFTVADSLANELHAYIDLVLARKYDGRIGVEAFQTQDRRLPNANFPGVGVTLNLANRNLFGRAERLDIQAAANISWYRQEGGGTRPFYQVSGRANLAIPSFLFVETPRRNLLRFRPTTSFSLGALQEVRQEFNRTTFNFDWNYTWFNIPFSDRAQMTLSPLILTYVRSQTTPEFDQLIDRLVDQGQAGVAFFILRDFLPRFLSRISFYYTYNGDYGRKGRPSLWFRPGVELGGTIPYLIDLLDGGLEPLQSDGDIRSIGNDILYGQFFRVSSDLRYYLPTGPNTALVSRLFLGYAHGIFANPFVPFENRFYTGGVSSVRGWLSNSLGPGTIPTEASRASNVVALGGEIAAEANVEYRFPLVSLLSGALFVDVGNVWLESLRGFEGSDATLQRGLFRPENLEVGVAAGIGFRLDLTFLIVRLDLGQQLYAPDIRGWVVKSWPRDIGNVRLQYNIGIGYPF